MEEEKVMSFRNILVFKSSLEKDLEELKKRSEVYSKTIGEKLRVDDTANTPDLADLREKIAGPSDPKKKKPVKIKDQKGNWHDLGGVFIYDGIGLRGEIEIYFKALEEVKSRIEKLQKIKESVDGLVSRGVKKDLGCTAFLSRDLLFDMAFTKSAATLAKFSYKSIFNVEAESQ
ncbi:MAG: hypothetical protein WBF38_07090 [Nitrosotalea sp.]